MSIAYWDAQFDHLIGGGRGQGQSRGNRANDREREVAQMEEISGGAGAGAPAPTHDELLFASLIWILMRLGKYGGNGEYKKVNYDNSRNNPLNSTEIEIGNTRITFDDKSYCENTDIKKFIESKFYTFDKEKWIFEVLDVLKVTDGKCKGNPGYDDLVNKNKLIGAYVLAHCWAVYVAKLANTSDDLRKADYKEIMDFFKKQLKNGLNMYIVFKNENTWLNNEAMLWYCTGSITTRFDNNALKAAVKSLMAADREND